MKKITLILILLLTSLLCIGQTKYVTNRELILPKDIGINRFCNNRFSGNYWIGNNYWSNIKIPIRIKEPKPYLPPKTYILNLKINRYKIKLVP